MDPEFDTGERLGRPRGMRLLIPLLALSAFPPAHARQEKGPTRDSFFLGDYKRGIAPDKRRALIIGKALWQAGVSEAEAKSMENYTVRRVGDAWLFGAHYSGAGDVLDGSFFIAFDAFDGGVFSWSPINPPTDEFILKALKTRRKAVNLKK